MVDAIHRMTMLASHRGLAICLLPGALMLVAMPLGAQAAPEAPLPDDSTIQWNFRQAEVAPSGEALRERWAAPFAVESRGRTAPRVERPVVVLHDSAAARRAADAVVAVGESAAEVLVEGEGDAAVAGGGGSPGRIGAAVAAASTDPEESEPAVPEEAVDGSDLAEPSSGSGTTGAAPAAPSAPSAAERPDVHPVAYGETWYGIAIRYGVPSRELAAANPEVDPERLRAGTRLRIPAAGRAAPVRTHTVVRGDTLFGLARRYGVSPDALRAANRMTDDVVRLGQTLTIPQEEASR